MHIDNALTLLLIVPGAAILLMAVVFHVMEFVIGVADRLRNL